jgi:hypothetical protein
LDGKITYLKTDSAIELLKKGKGLCPKDHILITHNSDFSITLDLSHQAENTGFPRHWFAQNVLVQDTKITPIPIGLERVRWFPHLHKRDILLDLMGKPDITPSNLCLANFSLSTNYSQRKACLDFCNTFSTVSVDNLVNQKSYISFIESIRDHYFVLCPEGNGIDTHRLWETLYLGRIPVVTNNITIESFKDLPILIIPSWDYLTKDILIKYLNDFQNGKIHYSLNKLDFKYWEKCIKEQINEDFIYPN